MAGLHIFVPTWIGDLSWHDDAGCRELGNNPRYWFALPDGRTSTNAMTRPEILRALAVCWNSCPVRLQCWAQATADSDAVGVWGGEYWPADRTVRRNMRARGPTRRDAATEPTPPRHGAGI